MVLGERWQAKRHFDGLPKLDDFELIKEDLGPLKDGEIYFESEFISVDPYQRYFSKSTKPPCTMAGSSVAVVRESKHEKYPVGSRIVTYAGWVKKGKLNVKAMQDFVGLKGVATVPDLKGLSSSLHLGACGMPGVTAYHGLLSICHPKPGETVLVNAAAGAVGSLVGQIAKLNGCKAIGYAGTDEKVQWLKKELGFDEAFNYKKVSAEDSLKQGAPNGVDCFFENVGDENSYTIMNHMNQFGRVSICGIISQYNRQGAIEKITSTHHPILTKELKVEGFIVGRWTGPEWDKAVLQLAEWIREGKLKVQETVINGFEKTPEAFIGLFSGKNTGKMVVKC